MTVCGTVESGGGWFSCLGVNEIGGQLHVVGTAVASQINAVEAGGFEQLSGQLLVTMPSKGQIQD